MTLREYTELTKRWYQEQERLDYRSAQIVCILANINRDPSKRKEPFDVTDFMAFRTKAKVKQFTPSKPQTVEQMKAMSVMLNAAFGGKISKRD